MNELIQIWTSGSVRKSINSDRDFGVGSQINQFRSGLWSRFANQSIQIGTLEHVMLIFFFF